MQIGYQLIHSILYNIWTAPGEGKIGDIDNIHHDSSA